MRHYICINRQIYTYIYAKRARASNDINIIIILLYVPVHIGMSTSCEHTYEINAKISNNVLSLLQNPS